MRSLSARIASALSDIPLAAKRQSRKNSPESWVPYYAGYSVEFAESVLRAANLPRDSVIYDPWNGSGTTTLVANMLGYRSYGVDLNPAAVLLAKARLVDRLDARGVQGLIRRLAQNAKRARGPCLIARHDPLQEWLPTPVVASFRHMQQRIVTHLASPNRGRRLDVADGDFPPLASFVLLSLIRTASALASIRQTSNPARMTPGTKRLVRRGHLEELWPQVAEQMSLELPVVEGHSASTSVALGDARNGIRLIERADFVLTSPPYLTRLDYAEATSFILAALGIARFSPTFDELRRNLMGAPLVRRDATSRDGNPMPRGITELLAQVRKHPSKASDSYYYKTYCQYFDDARSALRSLHLNMKRGSFAALVVQSSYYKDIRVDLPNLYVELAKTSNFGAQLAFESPVTKVISTIHPGTKTYRTDVDYRESVVLLERN